MATVLAKIPQEVLDWRRSTGADQYDEMWEGVLHMSPSPNREHQDLEGALETWLRQHWASKTGGRVYHQINVAPPGGWAKNYRIPDLVLLLPDRFGIDRNEYFEGAPTAVVEIRSPDDETLDKLPFYADLGVPEVWVIERSTRNIEVHRLAGKAYRRQRVVKSGWMASPVTGIEFRTVAKRLRLRLTDDHSSVADLP